jgi:hypothetical protein
VVDLQKDERFRSLDVELLSIAPDPVDAWREEGGAMGIREFETVLSDEGNQVAYRFGVMRWAAATGEPGHTFILVDEAGHVSWLPGLRCAGARGHHVRPSEGDRAHRG